MALKEQMAFLEGYIEGLEIKDDTKEGKAILAIVDLLDEIVEDLVETEEDVEELDDVVDELDEDLGELEEFLYGDICNCDCCDDDDEDDEDYEFGDIIFEEEDD